MSVPLLELKNVNKHFGGVVAAKDISFTLQQGEIMGLIGPNGAGKTTLLNLISGIYDTDEGEIWIEGKNVTKFPAYKRARMGLSRTFQTPQFLERSTIKDNLLLGDDLRYQKGYLKSYFSRENREFTEELDELMDIAGFSINWDDDISVLPFGQQKILEIVRTVLENPKILLIDEPAAGLNDAELERSMALMRYEVNKGVGIILIEHKMDMVMNFCKNILVLNFGEMIAYGTADEVSKNEAVIEAYLGREYNADN